MAEIINIEDREPMVSLATVDGREITFLFKDIEGWILGTNEITDKAVIRSIVELWYRDLTGRDINSIANTECEIVQFGKKKEEEDV